MDVGADYWPIEQGGDRVFGMIGASAVFAFPSQQQQQAFDDDLRDLCQIAILDCKRPVKVMINGIELKERRATVNSIGI